MGVEFFHAYRQTDRQTDMTKLVVAFRKFANASKKKFRFIFLCHKVVQKFDTPPLIIPWKLPKIVLSHFVCRKNTRSCQHSHLSKGSFISQTASTFVKCWSWWTLHIIVMFRLDNVKPSSGDLLRSVWSVFSFYCPLFKKNQLHSIRLFHT